MLSIRCYFPFHRGLLLKERRSHFLVAIYLTGNQSGCHKSYFPLKQMAVKTWCALIPYLSTTKQTPVHLEPEIYHKITK